MTRRQWYSRHRVLVVCAGIVALVGGGYVLLHSVFITDRPTSFSATIETAQLQFYSGGTPVDPEENDAGFLAPTRPLDLEIVGCSRLQSQDAAATGPAARDRGPCR